jgi:hypothetical protein
MDHFLDEAARMIWRTLIAVMLLSQIPTIGAADNWLFSDGEGGGESNDCCPDWTVSVEALLMRRRPSDDQPLTDLVPQWNVADMAFNYEFGPRVSIERHFDSEYSFEVNYFGIYDQGANLSGSDNAVQVVGPGFQYANVGAQPYQFQYDSNLNSLELNLRREWSDRTKVSAGFRWVELSEQFNHVGNTTQVYSLDTNNQLYGFQLGAEHTILPMYHHRFRVDGFAKAGVFYNSASGNASSAGAFGTPAGNASATKDRTSFVAETGLAGVFQLRDGLDLRVGYQVLWIEGIATAPNQLPNFSTVTSVATLNTNYGAFYHGGFVGLVGRF